MGAEACDRETQDRVECRHWIETPVEPEHKFVEVPDEKTLTREVAANVALRNAQALPVKWRFTTEDARVKLQRLYPSIST